MADEVSTNREEMMNRLKELVLDHLGMPRPGAIKHAQDLQDRLLPAFIERSRHAWLLAASPMPLPNDPSSWSYLAGQTQSGTHEIDSLNKIFEEMGVHDLMQDVADSPEITAMSDMPVDPYEERILKAAGHPNPSPVMKQLLLNVAKDPGILANSNAKLRQASQASLRAHRDINIIIKLEGPMPAAAPVAVAPASPSATSEKPKRRKLLTGLGKLFSGLPLLSGNGILVPTVPMGLTAVPVFGSLAGGFAFVTEGVGQLLREGE